MQQRCEVEQAGDRIAGRHQIGRRGGVERLPVGRDHAGGEMSAGGMAAHHDALARSASRETGRRLRLLDDLADRDLRREIVAGHRDGDAVRVHAARHLAEARRLERAPVAAVDEQRERAALSSPPRGLNRSMVWRARGAVFQPELGAAFSRGLGAIGGGFALPSARKSADARAPARDCCIQPRSRSPCMLPASTRDWSMTASRWQGCSDLRRGAMTAP